MLSGIVTMASVTTTSCRQGAKAPWAPASSERRSAIGAPGEIAITMMPALTETGRSTWVTTRRASSGTSTSTDSAPRSSGRGVRQR